MMLTRMFLLLVFKGRWQSWATTECQSDQTAHLQVSNVDALETREASPSCFLSDFNSGVCGPDKCTQCAPTGGVVIPSTSQRFPGGSLTCSGAGGSNGQPAQTSCVFSNTWPSSDNHYEFWSSKDHLSCGRVACSQFNLKNPGAVCCNGLDACKRSTFEFNGVNKCGFADVCCQGQRHCEDSIFTGVRNMVCGDGCRNVTATMTGNLVVAGNTVAEFATFTFKGGPGTSHCARLSGGLPTQLTSSTLTFEGGNAQLRCNGGSYNACGGAKVKVAPGTCLHVVCGDQDETSNPNLRCNNFKLEPLIPDNLGFSCYCTGSTGCNWIGSIRVGLGLSDETLCKRTTAQDPNPCGSDICPGQSPCCLKDETLLPRVNQAAKEWQDCSGCDCDVAPDGTIISDTESGATVVGDPHLRTLDGRHYTLMQQGNFLLWGFSGKDLEVPVETSQKKLPVDFEVFTHYAGHAAFTKGLMLVDKSTTQKQALEVTAKDCLWRHWDSSAWFPVESVMLNLTSADGSRFGAFQLSNSKGGQKKIELWLQEKGNLRSLAQLWVSCRAGHQLSAKIKMSARGEDLRFVRGELAPGRLSLATGVSPRESALQTQTDPEFALADWASLGGSPDATSYFKAVDTEGSATSFNKCSEEDKKEYVAMCEKHLGDSTDELYQQVMDDCVFDFCLGAGETSAELAAEILHTQ